MKHLRDFLNPRAKAEAIAAQTPDLALLAEKIAAQVLHGPHAIRKAGSGESFWQYRDYIAGDMPGQIDWRQSGKTDSVFIREKEQHKTQAHYFWAKRNADMDFSSRDDVLTKKQSASILALALSLLYNRSGGLSGYLGAQRPGSSERSLQTLEALLMDEDHTALPSASLDVARNAHLVLFSDFLEPLHNIETMLKALAARTHNIMLVQILDPAELSLPYRGRVIFEATSGGNKVHLSNAADIADAYQARIKGHNTGLDALAKRFGFSFYRHVTDQDPALLLHAIWKDSQKGRAR